MPRLGECCAKIFNQFVKKVSIPTPSGLSITFETTKKAGHFIRDRRLVP